MRGPGSPGTLKPQRREAVRRGVLAAGLACAVGNGLAQVPAAAPDPRPQEVPCAGLPKLHGNGRIEQCTLAREHRLGEVTLPAQTQVKFHPMGGVAEAVLGAQAEVRGQVLPAQATLFFDSAGRVRHFWLLAEATLQGHRLRGMGTAYSGHLGHMLHANGNLRAAWLAGEEVIDRIPCASRLPVFRGAWHAVRLGAQAMVWFHPDGRLRQAMLARDATVQGRAFKKGEVVSLRKDGTLDPAAEKLDWKGWAGFRED